MSTPFAGSMFGVQSIISGAGFHMPVRYEKYHYMQTQMPSTFSFFLSFFVYFIWTHITFVIQLAKKSIEKFVIISFKFIVCYWDWNANCTSDWIMDSVQASTSSFPPRPTPETESSSPLHLIITLSTTCQNYLRDKKSTIGKFYLRTQLLKLIDLAYFSLSPPCFSFVSSLSLFLSLSFSVYVI